LGKMGNKEVVSNNDIDKDIDKKIMRELQKIINKYGLCVL